MITWLFAHVPPRVSIPLKSHPSPQPIVGLGVSVIKSAVQEIAMHRHVTSLTAPNLMLLRLYFESA